jgi:hypothetical protein
LLKGGIYCYLIFYLILEKKFEKNEQKNNKNPKKYVIDVFASFSVLSQKDSNFKCLFNVFDF